MLGLSKLGFALAALAKERVSKLRRMMKNCSEATSLACLHTSVSAGSGLLFRSRDLRKAVVSELGGTDSIS